METVKLSDITAAEIRAYAGRDWASAARAKEDYWIAQRDSMTAAEALALADGLRRFSREVRPDWPTDADREEDFAAHERLARMLELASWRRGPE